MPEPASRSLPRQAAAPFNKPSADLILRSCDYVDFRVRRAILAEASPVFDDMLSIPQPHSCASDELTTPPSPPIVTLTESARTLDHLLRFCYPVPKPTLPTLDDVLCILEAARKYLMDAVLHEAQHQFADHAAREPLRAYALACSRGWSNEMRLAARASLAHPLAEARDAAALDMLSAGAYLRLQAYHRACRRAACALQCYGAAAEGARRVWAPRRSKRHVGAHVEPWWAEYMERAREALSVRPCGSTVLVPELSYKFLVDVVAKLPLYEKMRVMFDLAQFNLEYAESVDRAIAEVRVLDACLRATY